MNGTWAAIIQYAVPTLGVVIAAAVSGWFSHRAARKAHEVSKATAEAAISDTFTRAYEAADRHWAVYNQGLQKWNESLQGQISDNARRIEDAEMRAEAEKVSRSKAEHLYSMAIIYLRRVIRWIDDNLPGENYPSPPPELNLDL